MDMRTGRTYESIDDALADGVPVSDIAHVEQHPGEEPKVRFITSGPFKGRAYKRNHLGQMVRVR